MNIPPIIWYFYLRNVHNYGHNNALISCLMRYCHSKQEMIEMYKTCNWN